MGGQSEHRKVAVSMPMEDEDLRWDDAVTAQQEERLVAAAVRALQELLEHPLIKDIKNPLMLREGYDYGMFIGPSLFLDAQGLMTQHLFGKVRVEPNEHLVRDFRLNPGDVRDAVKRLEA